METLLNTKNFKDIRTVHLLFGPECNMQCRHCHQTPCKNVVNVARNVSDDTMQFLDNFIAYSQKEEFINSVGERRKLFKVVFYGGEALLYKETLKKIIVFFTEKYDLLKNRSFRFDITTNGLGLTKEFVDFLNKYQVHVGFSYDAPYPFAVRGYVPDSICDLVNQINDVAIISAGSAYNCDPLLARRCVGAKFPHATRYFIRMEVLRTFADMDEDIDTYDFIKIRIAIRKLCIATKMGASWAHYYLRNLVAPKIFPDSDWGYFHRTMCGNCISGRKKLAITLDGKVFFCCNSGETVGSLKEDSIESVFEKTKKIWINTYDSACKDCEGREYCYWGCILLLRDNKKHAFNCERYRKPFFKILKEETESLNKPLTNEEVIWFRKQNEIMKKQVQDFLAEGKRYEKEHTRMPGNNK